MVSTHTFILNTSKWQVYHPTSTKISFTYELHLLSQKVTIPTIHMKHRSSEEHLSPSWAPACDGFLPSPQIKRFHEHIIGTKILLWSMTNWWVAFMGLIVNYVVFIRLYIWFIIHSCINLDDFVGICKYICITQSSLFD